jgi:hypothetical protein
MADNELRFPPRQTEDAKLAQEIIRDIYTFDLGNFDTSFLESVQEQILEKGWISGRQLQALENILNGFENQGDQ